MQRLETTLTAALLWGAILLPVAGSAQTPATNVPAPGATAAGGAAENGGELSEAELEAVLTLGRGGYASNCSTCHGSNGEGDLGPSLVGNEILADAATVTSTIIHGFSYMPPFGELLTDQQVAAIATYVRNAWGNNFGPVTEEQAAAER